MSRKHRQIQKKLAVYDDLTPAEQAKILAHLQTCPECATGFSAYQQMDRALAALTKPAPQPGLRAEFQAKLDDEVRRRRRFFRLVSGWHYLSHLAGQAVALVLLVGLMGIMWLWLHPQQPFQPAAPISVAKPTEIPTVTQTAAEAIEDSTPTPDPLRISGGPRPGHHRD